MTADGAPPPRLQGGVRLDQRGADARFTMITRWHLSRPEASTVLSLRPRAGRLVLSISARRHDFSLSTFLHARIGGDS